MRYILGISLDMAELHTKENQNRLHHFGTMFFNDIANGNESPSMFAPLPITDFSYRPASPQNPVALNDDTRVLLLTDLVHGGDNERAMAARLRDAFSGGKISVIDLGDIPAKGGCKGCMKCGYDYTCSYRDGFSDFYNNVVRRADIIVCCGTVTGRYLSSRWKWFFDRAFFWNHTPSLAGKQMAWIISGPLRQNPHLAQTLEATVTARQFANLVDIVSDEDCDSETLDRLIDSLARRICAQTELRYVAPQNFLALGGHKIFRDEIFGRLRAVWQADYRYYKQKGMFDFPHKKWPFRILGTLVLLFSTIPFFRKTFYNMLQQPPPLLVRIVNRTEK